MFSPKEYNIILTAIVLFQKCKACASRWQAMTTSALSWEEHSYQLANIWLGLQDDLSSYGAELNTVA